MDLLFKQYGYELKEHSSSYRVYLLNQGMYHGAEIQMFDDTDPDPIATRYSLLGYHAKKQHFASVEEAENYLFKGFFNTQTTANDINTRYSEFAANQVKHYGDNTVKYKYIAMPYSVSGDEAKVYSGVDIVSAIKSALGQKGARLIIVEAAAGFGKTCTVYELYRSFLDNCENQKPIFTELSRNRDAKRFKYVLWSEIDREKDTTAKQELVVYNIKKGKIPLIIDGFDELLSKDIDYGRTNQLGEFEQVETMLSTIGDLLEEETKIILTSRKTAIFAGAEFGDWVDSYKGKFAVTRFQLEKPDIKQWLSNDRYEQIIRKSVPMENISNPVLLTYLRNIDSAGFCKLLVDPKSITDKYFEFLFERERERHAIIIKPSDQMKIFENLAKSFAEFDITGESRSFVKELIIDYNKPMLLCYLDLMTTKQTLGELADTLTNHALLDRIGNKDFITFINEFILGYLLGKSVQKDNEGFLAKLDPLPESLIDLAIRSFEYSSEDDKNALWEKLVGAKQKMSSYLKITADCILIRKITGKYEDEGLNSYVFKKVSFCGKDCSFNNVTFIDSKFENCTLDVLAFQRVTFIGCTFIDCSVSDFVLADEREIHCFGCEDYDKGVISKLDSTSKDCFQRMDSVDINLEIKMLGKYFKVDGKTPKMRYVSSIRQEYEEHELDAAFAVFERLRKDGMILINGNNSFISKKGISFYHKKVQS